MNRTECPREADILERITSDGWPSECGIDVRRHVQECRVCADLVEVAMAIRGDHRRAIQEAHIPPPSLVWWRAELRLRQDASRRAARPITLVHALAGASSVALVAALVGVLLPSIRGGFTRFAAAGLELVPRFEVEAGTLLMAGIPISLPFLIGIGCCLMLASLAACWILSEK